MIKVQYTTELKLLPTFSEASKSHFEKEFMSLFNLFSGLPESIPESEKHFTAIKLFMGRKSKMYKVTLTEPVMVDPYILIQQMVFQLEDRFNDERFYLFDFMEKGYLYLRTRSRIVGMVSLVKKGEARHLMVVSISRYSDKVVDIIKTLSL